MFKNLMLLMFLVSACGKFESRKEPRKESSKKETTIFVRISRTCKVNEPCELWNIKGDVDNLSSEPTSNEYFDGIKFKKNDDAQFQLVLYVIPLKHGSFNFRYMYKDIPIDFFITTAENNSSL